MSVGVSLKTYRDAQGCFSYVKARWNLKKIFTLREDLSSFTFAERDEKNSVNKQRKKLNEGKMWKQKDRRRQKGVKGDGGGSSTLGTWEKS